MALSSEDKAGLMAAVVCGFVGWYDVAWRPFWLVLAAVFAVWTVISIAAQSRRG